MNRTEYSLSLDSVICRRCNTVSRAEENTCPSCGADRQGAIFTSAAEAAATAAAAAATMPDEQLDIVDLRDTGWLKRTVRRKMVTSYPSLAEPGDETQAPSRKPARTGLAVLIGGVFAGLAAGGYWYVHSDDEAAPARARPAISAAGAIHDGASVASDARHASLARSKPEAAGTQAQTVAPASSVMARTSRAHETQTSEAPRTVAQASGAKSAASRAASEPAAQVAVAGRPATPAPSITGSTAARTEPSGASPAASPSGTATVATTPAKPQVQTTPTAATTANTVPTRTQPDKPSVAAGAIASMTGPAVSTAPSTKPAASTAAAAVDVSKPAAPSIKPAASPTVIAAAPAAKPEAPIVGSVQHPPAAPSIKPATSSTVIATAPTTKPESHESSPPAAAGAMKPAAPIVSSVQHPPAAAAPSIKPTTSPSAIAAAPATKPEAHDSSTLAAANKPAAPNTGALAQQPTASPSVPRATALASTTTTPMPARSTATAIASNTPAALPQHPATKDKPAAPKIASIEKPAAPPVQPVQEAPSPSVARDIAAVQQALANRDLASARRHMRGLYASQPRSPEIQTLAADLSRQERARDSAIASARSCTANKEPNCAIRNGRRAVALDPRNAQAQQSLRHALAVQNEANTEYFRQASALPSPVPPAMTFDGRWSVSARHSATSSVPEERSRFTLFGWGVPTVSKGRGDAH